jgi:hypothetical protein
MAVLDPCSVLGDREVGQLDKRGMEHQFNPATPDVGGNVPTCTWQSNGGKPHSGIYVQGVTYRGFDDVRADPAYPQQTFVLRGFPAVTRDNSSSETRVSCQVFVDVADGQTFEVAYDIDAGTTRAQACERAKQAADFGMGYLLNRS